ncbi:22769_t:CDS:2 [Rhizophagus irregularis]|nr:22769_t:CDS:2 [Rhizophagus irregularis]
MASYEKLMPKFEGENLEVLINSILQENEHLHILAPHGEQPLHKKGKGKAIHVSDFLCETIGRLQLNEKQKLLEKMINISHEARVIMNPGTNNDSWWNIELLIIDHVIPIFEATHPRVVAIFAFDNSTSHGAFSSDTLIANRMNVKPGGKQSKMKNTVFNGNVQYMNYPDNFPDESLHGKPKGMRQILHEHQLLKPGLKGFCKNKDSTDNQCLANRYSRDNCDYTWNGLQQIVFITLKHVSSSKIRAYARKSYRYMDAYRKVLNVKQAEYTVKKYKRHRIIPNNILQNII